MSGELAAASPMEAATDNAMVSLVSRPVKNDKVAEMSRGLAEIFNSGFSGSDDLHRHSNELGL
jgi:hypothetical protein